MFLFAPFNEMFGQEDRKTTRLWMLMQWLEEAGGVGRPLDRLINAGSLQSKQSGAGLGERTPHWAVKGDLRRALKGGFKGAFRGAFRGLKGSFSSGA